MDSIRCWNNSLKFWSMLASFLQIFRLCFHAVNLLFWWIQIWWPWKPLRNKSLLFMKPCQGDFCFVTWCIIMLDIVLESCVNCGHVWMHMKELVLMGTKCSKKTFPTSFRHLHQECSHKAGCYPILMIMYVFLNLFWNLVCSSDVVDHSPQGLTCAFWDCLLLTMI